MDDKVFTIKPSTKLMYLSAFTNLGAFILLCILMLIAKNALESIFTSMPNFFGPIATIAFLFAIGCLIKDCIVLSTTYYTLTDKTFVTQKGFFTIKRENMELFRIVDISSSEPFIYRILGIGNVTLRTIDQSDPTIFMEGLDNHQEIEKTLKEYSAKKRPTVIESYRNGADTHPIND